MFRLLKDAFKVKDIRSKILFTVFVLFVFRLGAHITVPGVNAASLQNLSSLPFFNMLNLVSGSAMQNFSIFSMGVSPYITASIVIQLLQMDIVPRFVEWSKQGEVGRKKLNQATRYLTLVLAFIQSMIIFAGIISRLPESIREIYEDYFINIDPSDIWKSAIFVAILLVAVLLIVTFVTFFQQAERKIPIQYTKRVAGAPTSSYLPLKVNAAGVIPVIFASSFIATPNAVLQALSGRFGSENWYKVMMEIFNYNTAPGATIYTILIVAFTFFYAFVQVNPEKLAENLQKQGSYIPSVRPGKGTEEYVSRLLMRLSTVGAVFLGLVALLPIIAQMVWDLPQSIGLGGTSLLIVIGVALETAKQLEGLMLKRKYVGFIE